MHVCAYISSSTASKCFVIFLKTTQRKLVWKDTLSRRLRIFVKASLFPQKERVILDAFSVYDLNLVHEKLHVQNPVLK